MNLYTIGFSGKNAETFFNLLTTHKIKTLLDIRLNNRSQLAGFTKVSDLPWFLHTICNISYVHMPDLAPDADLLKAIQSKAIDWQIYQARFTALLQARNADDLILKQLPGWLKPVCLLCSEPSAEQCHRSLIAERMSGLFKGIKIIHL